MELYLHKTRSSVTMFIKILQPSITINNTFMTTNHGKLSNQIRTPIKILINGILLNSLAEPNYLIQDNYRSWAAQLSSWKDSYIGI